jgi:hypothetical protein
MHLKLPQAAPLPDLLLNGLYLCACHYSVPQECRATVINTPVKRRLDLAKAATTVGSLPSATKLFGGSTVAPGSPKRSGGGMRERDLLTTRSGLEE